jgi:hypothetical protein
MAAFILQKQSKVIMIRSQHPQSLKTSLWLFIKKVFWSLVFSIPQRCYSSGQASSLPQIIRSRCVRATAPRQENSLCVFWACASLSRFTPSLVLLALSLFLYWPWTWPCTQGGGLSHLYIPHSAYHSTWQTGELAEAYLYPKTSIGLLCSKCSY